MSELYRKHRLATDLAEAQPLFAATAAAVPGLSRHKARMAITAGLLRIGERLCCDPQEAVGPGRLELQLDLSQGIPSKRAQADPDQGGGSVGERPFRILHLDPEVVVIDKAAGQLSAPVDGDSKDHVLTLLRSHLRARELDDRFLGVVHRIDRDTSGCLVVARSQPAQRLLQAQFAKHSARRVYRCLVGGQPRRDADTLSGRIGRGPDGRRAVVETGQPGKDAITHFEVRARYARGADLACWLETGRTHQIRVHLAAIGCPVLGDPLYGPQRPRRARDRRRQAERGGPPPPPKAPRLMLHAWKIAFDHPRGGQRLELVAELPDAFAAMAKTLAG